MIGFKNKFILPSQIDIALLVLTILSINNTNEIIASIIGIIFFSLSIYFLIRKKYDSYFVILLLNSYQSNGYGLYNLNLLGISPIYFTQLLILFLNLKLMRVSKNLLYNFPLIVFIPIYLVVGLLNSINELYYLKDLLRFLIFFSSLFLFSIPEIRLNYLRSFLKYTVIFFPVLLIFNAMLSPEFKLGQEQNYFFDETSSVFILTGFSILYHYKFRYKTPLWILFAMLIYIKISYFYFSTIELLSLVLLLIVISLKNVRSFKKVFKLTSLITISILCLVLIIDFIPKFTLFKYYQLVDTFLVVLNGNDILTLMPFSPKIRILEFLNSYADLNSKSIFNLLFGNGFGSFFQYNFYPYTDYGISSLYETGSYNDNEIMENKFFTGHNTFSFILIKMGVISIFIFLRLFVKGILKYLKSIVNDPLIPVFAIYILMNLGYGNKNFILIAFMICYLIFNEKNKPLSFSYNSIL